MAIKLMTVNGVNNENIAEFIVDSEDEKSQIPAEYMVQGTEAQVIEGGKRYRLDCNLQWVEIKPYSSGGGGGGGSTVRVESVSITQNGTVNAPYGKAYTPIYVDVENTYAAADEGKVVSNGALVAQTTRSTIIQNGTYDTTLNNSVKIDVDLSGEAEFKDVNFIDYDGRILYSYTAQEIQNLQQLPSNPVHNGLISQGWNWTLEDIKGKIDIYKKLYVGQLYETESGATEIDIFLEPKRLSPYLCLKFNGTISINWGDNTPLEQRTNSTTGLVYIQHNYLKEGSYTISIFSNTGSITLENDLMQNEFTGLLSMENQRSWHNRTYLNMIKAIRLGRRVSIGEYAFYCCKNLGTITFPNVNLSIGRHAFDQVGLFSLTLPTTVFLDSYNIYNALNLNKLSLPKSLIYDSALMFLNNQNLNNVIIPEGVTSIFFQYCYKLTSIIVPQGVSIQEGAFTDCVGLKEIHFKATTPPTIPAAYTFRNIPTDCIIYVPSGRRTTYMSTTNYPDPNTYTYIEEA